MRNVILSLAAMSAFGTAPAQEPPKKSTATKTQTNTVVHKKALKDLRAQRPLPKQVLRKKAPQKPQQPKSQLPLQEAKTV